MPSRPKKFAFAGGNPNPIDYTSREYESIRQDLLTYAKRYYPDSLRDFSENSFGSYLIDSISYVGDILSFYMDYNANEAFLDTASQFNNIVRLAKNSGYKYPGRSSAYGVIAMYVIVPSNNAGTGPDLDYLKLTIKRNTRVRADGTGDSFLLLDNVRFDRAYNDSVVARVDETTGVPTAYALKSYGRVVSGQFAVKNITIGNFQKFRQVIISDSKVSEILTVVDSDGNRYYEVDYLSQNVIYREIINPDGSTDGVPSIMKPVAVQRRFVTERHRSDTVLQFGYGSEEELKKPSVANPKNILLDVFGKDYFTDVSFDPSKLMGTDKFGVGPANTTLTVTYRQNSPGSSNIPAGRLKTVASLNYEFDNPSKLNQTTRSEVLASIECYNESPIVGDLSVLSKEDIRQHALDMFPTQNRAVTKLDYEAIVYAMHPKYGSVKCCAIFQDPDSLKRNLNLYILSENQYQQLTVASDALKRNLKTWLIRYKMLNDTIDVLDGKIVNIGINFTAKMLPGRDRESVLNNCLNRIKNATSPKYYFGEPFDIARIYKLINTVPGVMDCLKVELVTKSGSPYSSTRFNLDRNISADGTQLNVPKNVILEVKFANADIKGSLR